MNKQFQTKEGLSVFLQTNDNRGITAIFGWRIPPSGFEICNFGLNMFILYGRFTKRRMLPFLGYISGSIANITTSGFTAKISTCIPSPLPHPRKNPKVPDTRKI